MIIKDIENPLEELCIKYVPSRYLGDLLPAHITVEIARIYAQYLSRLEDCEAHRHLIRLGVSKKRAENFVRERNELKGVKSE